MYRIDNATAAAALPAPSPAGPNPGHFFTEGDPQTATPATVVNAEWLNMVQEELANIALAAGGALDKADRTQCAAAIATLIANATTPNAPSAKDANFTANEGANRLYVVNPAAAAAVATCVQASAVLPGHSFRVLNDSDGKGVTVVPFAGDTIDGQAVFRVPGRSIVELTRTGTTAWSVTVRPAHMVGEVVEWRSDTLPAGGWAWVNGVAKSRTAEAGLFAEWGTTYGIGDGSTTFGIPDDKGRVKAGRDNMGGAAAASRLTAGGSGVDGATLGAAGGSQTHALTGAENGVHGHGAGTLAADAAGDHNHPNQTNRSNQFDATGGVSGAMFYLGTFGGQENWNTQNAGSHPHAISGATADGGSGTPHQNTQPTIVANFIVKL